nr:His/Gly/Thr/Pro-type tRNA ligase C-terminal domain-containing protein [Alphaproteobacteria bacterium]
IGVSRLVAAIIEASHDDTGIIWPDSVAPYSLGLINAVQSDAHVTKITDQIYDQLRQQNIEVLYDDRDERAGTKFSDMDLIGVPWQIIVGTKGIKNSTVEVKNRKTGQREMISQESMYAKFNNIKVGLRC